MLTIGDCLNGRQRIGTQRCKEMSVLRVEALARQREEKFAEMFSDEGKDSVQHTLNNEVQGEKKPWHFKRKFYSILELFERRDRKSMNVREQSTWDVE